MKRILLASLFALSLHAQRLEEQITVNVIEVPVYVTRGGNPVRGLTADDFELSVNGTRHPIKYFDVIETAPADVRAGQLADAQRLDRRRLVLLLFDTKTTSHRGIERAKEAALTFVQEASAGETFAVARLTRSGTQWIVPFTSDRFAVRRAIATLAPSRAGDTFHLATLPSERAGFTSGAPVSESSSATISEMATTFPTAASMFAAAAEDKEREILEQHRLDEQGRVTVQLATLADRLAPISGVKHVVFLSEGSPGGADHRQAREMYKRFHAAGVIFDAVAIDAIDVPNFQPASAFAIRPKPRQLWPENDKRASLYVLALETGGTVTKHGNIANALRELRAMQSVTYVLGFTPPSDQKSHNSVVVNVRGQPFATSVHYRRGYSPTQRRGRGDAIFLADVLLNDIAQRGLTLDLDVQQSKGEITVVASVPGRELLARGNDQENALLDVFFYVFDDQGVPTAWAYSQLRLDLTKGREFLESSPYTIRKTFSLASGKYTAKALVRVPDTDVAGFQKSDFEIGPATP